MKKFWTPLRVVSTVIVLTLVVIFTSCNSNDVTPTANTPTAAPAEARNNTAPAPLLTIPPSVMEASLRAASGSPIKLSNYSGNS